MARVLQAAETVDRLAVELAQARAELRVAVIEAREEGETVSEIARRLNVSRARIHQLLRTPPG